MLIQFALDLACFPYLSFIGSCYYLIFSACFLKRERGGERELFVQEKDKTDLMLFYGI